jgi:hypothetical protein
MQPLRGAAPLNLTTNPRLDTALQHGWQAWEDAVTTAGASTASAWLFARANGEVGRDELDEAVAALLEAEDGDDRATARAELAELLGGIDDPVAETLWEGVLAQGLATDDAETLFDATSHLAAIAEESGDPLAAAEYYIDFLNWRRQPDHSADPELVQTSFDEVTRLAERDGAHTAAAQFTYRQAAYARLAEGGDEQAVEGDWERDSAPYSIWA